jgi:hypothetical protein
VLSNLAVGEKRKKSNAGETEKDIFLLCSMEPTTTKKNNEKGRKKNATLSHDNKKKINSTPEAPARQSATPS